MGCSRLLGARQSPRTCIATNFLGKTPREHRTRRAVTIAGDSTAIVSLDTMAPHVVERCRTLGDRDSIGQPMGLVPTNLHPEPSKLAFERCRSQGPTNKVEVQARASGGMLTLARCTSESPDLHCHELSRENPKRAPDPPRGDNRRGLDSHRVVGHDGTTALLSTS